MPTANREVKEEIELPVTDPTKPFNLVTAMSRLQARLFTHLSLLSRSQIEFDITGSGFRYVAEDNKIVGWVDLNISSDDAERLTNSS